MPDIVQWLRLKGDSSSLKEATDSAGKTLLKNFTAANLAAQAVTKTLGIVKSTIDDAVEASLEYERTTLAVTTALKLQGREVSGNVQGLEAQAGIFESLSGISDEVIRKYQAQAINLGKTTSETNKLIRSALALSQVTGRDLRTSFEALLKLETGLVDRTVKLVPEIANLTKEQLKAGEAVDVIAEKYGELVGLGTTGAAGTLTRVKNEFANLGEELAKLANSEDGWLTTFNRRMADTLEFMRRAVADQNLSAWERFGLIFASTAEEANEYLKIMRDVEKTTARTAEQADKTTNASKTPALVGLPQREKSTGKGKREPGMFDDFLERGSADIIAQQQELNEAALQNERDYQELRVKTAKDADELLDEWLASRHEYRLEMDRQFQRDELAIQKDSFDVTAAQIEAVGSITQVAMGSALDAVVKLAEGSKVSAKELAVSMLKGVGKQLVGMGGAYILKGLARAYEHYGMDATAYGMIATGGAMVAMGGGLIAGGTAMSGGGGGGGGGGRGIGSSSGRGSSTVSDGGQLATRDRSEDTERRRGPETVTIVFQGPTTPEGIGVAVNDALGKARARGLI